MQKFLTGEKSLQKKYKIGLYSIWAFCAVLCLVLPLFVGKYYVGFMTLIFLYATLSIGFNIASGFCGVTTFATGAVYAGGAYVSGIMVTRFNLPFLLAVLLGIIVAALLSLVISFSAYKVSAVYLTLVSLGLLEVVYQIATVWYDVTGGSNGMHISKWTIFGLSIERNGKYYIMFTVLILCFVFQRNLLKSQWGRDFLAMKDDQIAASGLGINCSMTRVIGVLISAVITGMGGALYASYSGFISPESFHFNISIMILLMVVAGGSGTLSGPVLGAAIIYIIPEFFNQFPDIKQIIYGVMLVVLIQVMPKGVVGVIKDRFREIEDNTIVKGMETTIDPDFSAYHVEPSESGDILVLKGLTQKYGGVTAVNDLNITIKSCSIHALIGPNGAGKTTTVNNITGIELPTSGEVWYDGKLITGMRPFEIAHLGISRTYQQVRMFNSLSVIDSVVMGTRLSNSYSLWASIFQTKKKHIIDRENYTRAKECLDLIGLSEKINERPQNLSSGQQKLLEICRALVVKPKLLILDEPCAGLTETESDELALLLKKLKETGIAMLLIEHHMNMVMDVSDQITVIDHGTKIAEGTPAEISSNPVVRTAYLGEDVDA